MVPASSSKPRVCSAVCDAHPPPAPRLSTSRISLMVFKTQMLLTPFAVSLRYCRKPFSKSPLLQGSTSLALSSCFTCPEGFGHVWEAGFAGAALPCCNPTMLTLRPRRKPMQVFTVPPWILAWRSRNAAPSHVSLTLEA